jgi:hypothetical protein
MCNQAKNENVQDKLSSPKCFVARTAERIATLAESATAEGASDAKNKPAEQVPFSKTFTIGSQQDI